MGDHRSARVRGPPPVVGLAPPPQESPEVTACALMIPDHLADPFMAERDSVRGAQPKADRLWTPALRPQRAGDGAPHTARQLARLMSDLLLSGLPVCWAGESDTPAAPGCGTAPGL